MDVRCDVRTERLPGVQGIVLYEGSDVRTVNGFVLPRDRGLECASPKYETFIMQNTQKMFENNPWYRKITNTLTDIAGRADVVMNGEGAYY